MVGHFKGRVRPVQKWQHYIKRSRSRRSSSPSSTSESDSSEGYKNDTSAPHSHQPPLSFGDFLPLSSTTAKQRHKQIKVEKEKKAANPTPRRVQFSSPPVPPQPSDTTPSSSNEQAHIRAVRHQYKNLDPKFVGKIKPALPSPSGSDVSLSCSQLRQARTSLQ